MLSTRSLLLIALGGAAPAQTVLHTYAGSIAEASGAAVALWDDLDGDGRAEWAVGEPLADVLATDGGRVRVFSGATHQLLTSYSSPVANARLGSSLARIADLDGDGKAELAIGAPGQRSVLVVRSRVTAPTTWWQVSRPTLAAFGASIANAGDVDGDGTADVVVGAPGSAGSSPGAVTVLSGVDGTTIFEVSVPGLNRLGHSVAAAGDIDGDGLADVVAGAPLTFTDDVAQGAAAVLRGPAGAVAWLHRPSGFQNRGQEFGQSVAPAGDVDGDGRSDYAVGARWYGGFHYIDDSFVAVYSGATHGELWRVEGPSDAWFGHTLASVGDVDADGEPDLAVGDPLSGDVSVYSPRRNALLYRFDRPGSTYTGAALDGGPDVDGDGFPELIQGAAVAFTVSSGAVGAGEAQLLSWGCPPDAAYPYCATSPNSASASGARIGQLGSTSLAGNGMRLYATDCPTNTFALFFHGTEEALTPSGFGQVCVGGTILRLYPASPTGPGGVPTFDLDLAALGVAAGDTRYFQCWMRDNQAGTPGYNFSDGLRVTFCP